MLNFLLACFHTLSFFFFHHQTPVHHYKNTTQNISPTPTPSAWPSPSVSVMPSSYISPTPTPVVSGEPTATLAPTEELTPTPTITLTPTIAPTLTVTPTLTATPTPTVTPIPTITPTPTISISPTPTITVTPTVSVTPTITVTPTPTASPTPTISGDPIATPTATPTPTLTITPTATPTPTVSLTPSPTASPTPTPVVTKIGNDISYPQCGQTLPSGQGFGIIGINGGLATTTNSCLSTELLWAGQSLGTANQTKVQLYVNTGNPGGLNTPTWPQNNIDPSGNTASNPYGACDGSVSDACAWQYGWNRAVDDVQNKFIPAAQAAAVDTAPSDYPWWLDVETTNSWESGSTDALTQNREDLEAMVSYFQSKGIKVGIYSTNYQWGQIVGDVPSSSNLNGLANWRPGAADLITAQTYCSLTPLTSGGSVTMTQYTSNFDYDYSCL